MTYIFNIYAIPTFITATFLFGLGLFVFLQNYKSEVNFSFLLLCLSAAIWQLGYSFIFSSADINTALFWQKIVYFGVPFLAPTMYHFSVAYMKLRKQKKYVIFAYIIASMFTLINLYSRLLVNGMNKYFWGYYKKAGPLYTFFLILWLIPSLSSVFNLYRERNKSLSPLEYERRKYILIAFIIVFIGFWDFIPAYGLEVYPFGYIGVVAYLSIIAYAIVKYRLMNVAIAVTRTAIFIIVYSIVLGIPFILSAMFRNWFILHLGSNWWLGPFGSLFILSAFGPLAYTFLEKKAESILLREQRKYQEILKKTAVDLSRIRNLRQLLDFIAYTITKTVNISHAYVYIREEKENKFVLKSGTNINQHQPQELEQKNPLILLLESKKEPLVYEEVKKMADNSSIKFNYKSIEEKMLLLNANVIIPCFLENRMLNIIILGEKLSGKIYSSDDLVNFSFLASEAALATENALLYGKIEEEVKQRTEELGGVQKQLVQAEKLATVGTLAGGVAHEINNPLTAILTNVQMLLAINEDLDADTTESLQLIEEATKRCRTIVQKLMAYAKKPLEQADMTKINLAVVIKNVTSFLRYQLEQDNIKLVINLSEEEYPVFANQNELEQVITNMILNAKDAIKQVKKEGTIEIGLSRKNDLICIKIKDDGAGIPNDIISKIFDPFFTTKEIGKGLGLGLSICQAIIDKHKGAIEATSVVQKGSIFTIKIPFASKSKIETHKADK